MRKLCLSVCLPVCLSVRPQFSVAIDSQTDGQNHLKIGVCTLQLLVGAIGCVGTSQIYGKWVKLKYYNTVYYFIVIAREDNLCINIDLFPPEKHTF